MAEWFTALCRDTHGHRLEPTVMLLIHNLQVCGSERLGCHTGCTGITPEMNLRESTQERDPPWLRNPGQTSPEVQNRGISGPIKVLVSFQNKKV